MLTLEKAQIGHLEVLKDIATKAVQNMHENGLDLWNEFYPRDDLINYIGKDLYIAKEEDNIICFFRLYEDDESAESFIWSFENEIFLGMFTINVDFLHMGYGKKVLKLILEYLNENKHKSIRLTVYDKNIPAINLYEKIGFKKVEGNYVFINKFRKEAPKNFIGMEYNL